QRLYGGSVVAYLDRLGFLSPRVSLAHAVWLTPDDIATVARTGAAIAHNPMSNLNLGSGIAPVPAYLRAGIPVGLGTDGYSGGNHAMFEAMRLAAALHTVHTTDYAQWLRPPDVLRLATHGGATVAQLAGGGGALAVGRRADLVILGADSPALTPLNDLVDQLVYCERGAAVETVVVNGEVVVQGGRVATVDEPAILAEARRLAERLTERNRALFAFAREHEAHIHRAYFSAGDA
ncbi:MAG: amidohydrolase family protein, partial [Chloroflexi bacterium]|nr:amidohydrolase family protein [Chloroflexota bacterium]